MFQWAPTLGGECYALPTAARHVVHFLFQWAPTLGGECYHSELLNATRAARTSFNGHPPLGVNATDGDSGGHPSGSASFNGHPPLGVNATHASHARATSSAHGFNGHPPLGVNATIPQSQGVGCVAIASFNGHPPLGVNATAHELTTTELDTFVFQWAPTLGGECYRWEVLRPPPSGLAVSMGTHPWG